MSSYQGHSPAQDRHVFRGFMASDLEQFQLSREKYVALEAARSVIRDLVNDENNPNNNENRPSPHAKNNNSFKNTSKALINEIFELQSEMSKKEYLQEKMQLMDKVKEVSPPQSMTNSNTNDVLALQVEIEQAEILLQGLVRKNKALEEEISASEMLKAQAQEELSLVTQKASSSPSSISPSSTFTKNTTKRGSDSTAEQPVSTQEVSHVALNSNTKTEIERFKTQKANLLALTTGLESLFQLKLEAVELTSGNGVVMTTLINGTHYFSFELDEKKKVVDIQALKSGGEGGKGEEVSPVVDPLRLLCDCAQLPPPLDLRHALLATAAALRRDQALQRHLTGSGVGGGGKKQQPIHKLCLLQRDKKDSCKINVTFRNGVRAAIKIHNSYPDVPNGVHIESLVGGDWSEEELAAVKASLNSLCVQTLPDMVHKFLDAFAYREEEEEE